jgi:hypothetical protein
VTTRGALASVPPLVASLAFASYGCREGATTPPRPAVDVGSATSQREWASARALLEELRRNAGARATTQRVSVAMVVPGRGVAMRGRGAVAVDPGRALRMILVGPGGGTAVDAWVTNEAFDVALPPLERRYRGARGARSDATGGAPEGLPIGFFRWWFLRRFEGRLLSAKLAEDGRGFTELVLRDGDATATLVERTREGGRVLVAERRDGANIERLEASPPAWNDVAGARVTYVDAVRGLRAEVEVEAIEHERPDPSAFEDPEAAREEAL